MASLCWLHCGGPGLGPGKGHTAAGRGGARRGNEAGLGRQGRGRRRGEGSVASASAEAGEGRRVQSNRQETETGFRSTGGWGIIGSPGRTARIPTYSSFGLARAPRSIPTYLRGGGYIASLAPRAAAVTKAVTAQGGFILRSLEIKYLTHDACTIQAHNTKEPFGNSRDIGRHIGAGIYLGACVLSLGSKRPNFRRASGADTHLPLRRAGLRAGPGPSSYPPTQNAGYPMSDDILPPR